MEKDLKYCDCGEPSVCVDYDDRAYCNKCWTNMHVVKSCFNCGSEGPDWISLRPTPEEFSVHACRDCFTKFQGENHADTWFYEWARKRAGLMGWSLHV